MLDIIMKTSEIYEKKSSIEVCVKTMEELGEVAEAILSSKDISGCGYKGLTREDILEEVADVIICATSIAEKEGFSAKELEGKVMEKLAKWMRKLGV